MIEGIVGLPGSGKSLEAVRRAKVKHDAGNTHIYANLPLNLERSTLITPMTLTNVRAGICSCGCANALVLLDELHLWVPARRSLQLPASWLALFSQTRKEGWSEVLWTAQHETRVDRVIRDVTGWMWLAKHWTLPFDWFTYDQYPPETFRIRRTRVRRDKRRMSKSAAATYNTLGRITNADHIKDRNDVYAEVAAQMEER